MISPIYCKRNRGQVVTAACQWIWEHRVLAFRLLLLPMLAGELLLFLNMLVFSNLLVYVAVGIFASLFIPVLSNFMFHVVENPEEFGYPGHTHGLLRVYRNWWHYFWPIVKISLIVDVAALICSVTVVIPMVLPFLQLLAIVICQRDDDKGVIDCLTDAFKMIINSLGTALMCFLSSCIIVACMAGVPALMVALVNECMRTFMSKGLYRLLTSPFDKPDFNVYLLVVSLGICLSVQVVMVIAHFFYGHCKESADHPALIERMEQF